MRLFASIDVLNRPMVHVQTFIAGPRTTCTSGICICQKDEALEQFMENPSSPPPRDRAERVVQLLRSRYRRRAESNRHELDNAKYSLHASLRRVLHGGRSRFNRNSERSRWFSCWCSSPARHDEKLRTSPHRRMYASLASYESCVRVLNYNPFRSP